MAKQVIGIGTTANDGTGDSIRDAFDKCNDNFTELYTDDAGDVGSEVDTIQHLFQIPHLMQHTQVMLQDQQL